MVQMDREEPMVKELWSILVMTPHGQRVSPGLLDFLLIE
jgi:hypothetical protein